MKSHNICKFPSTPLISNALSILCFVRETKEESMKKETHLQAHRIALINQGSGFFSADGVRIDFSGGTLLFFFKGERISLSEGEGAVYTYIDFDGARADELIRRFNISKLSRRFDGFDGLIPIWQESLATANEENIDLLAESTLLNSFARLSRTESEKNGIIAKIAEITEDSFNDSSLSLGKIAHELSYNPKYISHAFKKKTGTSYSEYLRSVRLRYAVALFDHGLDSVKNVALLSGFSDPLYFSSVFKKQVGMSPKEYIESKEAKKDF